MAEFLEWRTQKGKVVPHMPPPGDDGFAAMGKPVPVYRKSEAYKHARSMGCSHDSAFFCVERMAEQLERDQPYEAMAAGMKHVDLVGTYRLMAVLLTAEPPSTSNPQWRKRAEAFTSSEKQKAPEPERRGLRQRSKRGKR